MQNPFLFAVITACWQIPYMKQHVIHLKRKTNHLLRKCASTLSFYVAKEKR